MNNQLYFTGFEQFKTSREAVLDQVPDSWKPIVDKLIDDLFQVGWNGEIAQIKEKFGGLRFYINYGSDAIFDLIDKAEDESETVCINCGELATTMAGWYNVCDLHRGLKC